MITSSPAQRSQAPKQKPHSSPVHSPTSFRTPRASIHKGPSSPRSQSQATTPIGPRPAPRRSSVVYYRDQGTQFPLQHDSPSARLTLRPQSSSSRIQRETTPQNIPTPLIGKAETLKTTDAVSTLAASGVHPEPPEPRVRQTPQPSDNGFLPTTDGRRDPPDADEPPSTANKVTPTSSAHKRPRTSVLPDDQKVMPADYSECDPKMLAELIANLLMDLISYNDRIPLKDGHLTRFHSRAPPGISVHDYLQRLTFHALLPPPILLSMVYYIDKLSALYSHFTINSLTVHRFLITAATVASKGLSDSFWTNNTYARVGGVSIRELALLELELLARMDWQIVPQNSRLEEYYVNLVERTPDYRLADNPSSAKTSKMVVDSEEPAAAASLASTQSSDEAPSSSNDDRDTAMGET